MVVLSPMYNIPHDAFRKQCGFLLVMVCRLPTMTMKNLKSVFATALGHLCKMV